MDTKLRSLANTHHVQNALEHTVTQQTQALHYILCEYAVQW